MRDCDIPRFFLNVEGGSMFRVCDVRSLRKKKLLNFVYAVRSVYHTLLVSKPSGALGVS